MKRAKKQFRAITNGFNTALYKFGYANNNGKPISEGHTVHGKPISNAK